MLGYGLLIESGIAEANLSNIEVDDEVIFGLPGDDNFVLPDSEMPSNLSWWDSWRYEIIHAFRKLVTISLVWFGIFSLMYIAHLWWK